MSEGTGPRDTPAGPKVRSLTLRSAWIVLGLGLTGIGGLGIIVPGLPSTVFFVGAAACFSRSSPRFERWLLSLPLAGRLVDDFREGRGMPLRSKAVTVILISVFTSVAVLRVEVLWLSAPIAVLGLTGIGVVTFWVPTWTGEDLSGGTA